MFLLKCVKRYLLQVLVILFFLMATTGCGLFPEEEATLAVPLVRQQEISYRTEEAVIGHIENSIICTGYLVPIRSEDHIFRHTSGRLKEIYVELGDIVKEGDIIAELLTDGLEDSIETQQRNLEIKRKSFTNSVLLAEADIKLAKEKEEELLQRFEAMKKDSHLYSTSEIEKAMKDWNTQKASLEKLIINTENQLETKKLELESSEIELGKLIEKFEKSQLRALMDGIVTYVSSAAEGNNIDAYSNIATVSDPKEMHLSYKGNDADKFKLGMTLEIEIGKTMVTGEVVLTPTSVPFEQYEFYKDTVRFRLDSIPEGVEKGDSGRIKLVLDSSENAVLVPRAAVRLYSGNYLAYVLEDGLRIERYVKKGIESGTMVEILEGIKQGEKVIVE